MGTILLQDRRLGTAVAASLAFHVLVALMIPVLAGFGVQAPALNEIAVSLVPRISIRRAPPAHPPAAVAPHQAPLVRQVAKERPQGTRPAPQSQPTSATDRSQAPRVAPMQNQGAEHPGSAAPVPSAPPQTQAPAVVARHSTSGYLPLGAEQPDPVLDPAVRRSLAALGVHTTLTVTVNEGGHTTSVAFSPPIDDAMEAQIRAMLASAAWDPAVCGAGVACEGTAVIRL
jgi:hypothetical protein